MVKTNQALLLLSVLLQWRYSLISSQLSLMMGLLLHRKIVSIQIGRDFTVLVGNQDYWMVRQSMIKLSLPFLVVRLKA